MPLKTKNLRKGPQKAAQAARSNRNKERRRAKSRKKDSPSMNEGHRRAKLRNRLNRLEKRFKKVGPDRQPQMDARIKEITKLLAG